MSNRDVDLKGKEFCWSVEGLGYWRDVEYGLWRWDMKVLNDR